ncbi:MAG: neutral/alkaline non-lysosomal ceramidase N-terminal domain-containing protein, partial [Hymenobacteraceae bacterium]|nr:neutral/alkaline non-lysosomal ceramidase N-terminal domain-containing protein [Hymenobacteraceae bacterium]MDX5394985.1 neutral/alkaline non-lysosomal ceramidase N-terminal domain-containing protein [Hymenobacteraceae bacterium]MDX5511018.1 neutral/alkaline non-lysosomal ceramidase N-terminal domain-containing protein [Hymenobacteraceae bacterium]
LPQQPYYRHTLQTLDTTHWRGYSSSVFEAGWAKKNITPPEPVALAGYGKRVGRKYKQVLDSVYVRALVFKSDSVKAALVTMDLLIVPMELTEQLQQVLPDGYSLHNTYLSATHTHHSTGNWARNPAGWVMAGRFRKKRVRQLALQIVEAIKKAEKNTAPAAVGFAAIPAPHLIKNRLVAGGETDSLLRIVKLKKQDGTIAVLASFSAHPTNLASDDLVLSADYPGVLVRELEQLPEVDFAAFAAGAVGSQKCAAAVTDREKAVKTGTELAQKAAQQLPEINLQPITKLQTIHLPLHLPEPHWRIGDYKRLAPGVFHTFFGNYPAFLSGLAVNDMVFLGTPVDFPAALLPKLQQQAKQQNLHVMVTSFNGGYMGYVVPDEQFKLNKYESRAMNFYGPYAGSYLQQLLLKMINKLH